MLTRIGSRRQWLFNLTKLPTWDPWREAEARCEGSGSYLIRAETQLTRWTKGPPSIRAPQFGIHTPLVWYSYTLMYPYYSHKPTIFYSGKSFNLPYAPVMQFIPSKHRPDHLTPCCLTFEEQKDSGQGCIIAAVKPRRYCSTSKHYQFVRRTMYNSCTTILVTGLS